MGATIDLEVGDAVQPIYDFIDIAWKVTFISTAVLLIMNMILQTVFEWGPFAMLLMFITIALVWTIRHGFPSQLIISRFLGKLMRLFIAVVLCIYAGLPLSITAARYLSMKISTPMIDQGVKEFEKLKSETNVEAVQEKYFGDDTEKKATWFNVKKKFGEFKDKAEEFIKWCGLRVVKLVEKGVRYCAGMIFDCLIFPGAALLVIYLTLKRGLAGFGVSTNRTAREDIKWMLERHLKSDSRNSIPEDS